jgi:AraC-like DNA-binding protein
MDISEQGISRIINQELGKPIRDYINEYRIEEARSRLEQENCQVNIIAYEVGFNSIATFNRVFKNATGHSPSEYRERQIPLEEETA